VRVLYCAEYNPVTYQSALGKVGPLDSGRHPARSLSVVSGSMAKMGARLAPREKNSWFSRRVGQVALASYPNHKLAVAAKGKLYGILMQRRALSVAGGIHISALLLLRKQKEAEVRGEGGAQPNKTKRSEARSLSQSAGVD
jgi:hypothetical protein